MCPQQLQTHRDPVLSGTNSVKLNNSQQASRSLQYFCQTGRGWRHRLAGQRTAYTAATLRCRTEPRECNPLQKQAATDSWLTLAARNSLQPLLEIDARHTQVTAVAAHRSHPSTPALPAFAAKPDNSTQLTLQQIQGTTRTQTHCKTNAMSPELALGGGHMATHAPAARSAWACCAGPDVGSVMPPAPACLVTCCANVLNYRRLLWHHAYCFCSAACCASILPACSWMMFHTRCTCSSCVVD